MTEWSTDTKNGYDNLEVFIEYAMHMCLWVQLAEIIPKWRLSALNKVSHDRLCVRLAKSGTFLVTIIYACIH